MIETLTVRPYQTNDEEEIVRFLILACNGWPQFDIESSSLDHWNWKFKDNPIGSVVMSLCIAEDKIVGYTARIPRRIKIGDNIFLAGSGADAAIHPSFRKMGVFSKMEGMNRELEAKSKISLFYAVSANPAIIKYYSANEEIFGHSVFTFVRIKDVPLHLQKVPMKNARLYEYGFKLAKISNDLRNALSPSNKPIQDFLISQIDNFDESIDAFWEEIKNYYTFIVERTKTYLNWRYCDFRGGNYIVKTAEKDGKILGYVVIRIDRWRSDYPIGYVVDFLTLPNRFDVANFLVEDAIREFDKENVNTVKCQIIKNNPWERIFQRHGFLNSRFRTHVFFVPHASVYREMGKISLGPACKIHFVYGDYDDI